MTNKKKIVEEGKHCYVCDSEPRTDTLKSKGLNNGDGTTSIFLEHDVKQFLKQLKDDLDEDADFCKKAGVIPSVHPRRIKEIIDKRSGFTEDKE